LRFLAFDCISLRLIAFRGLAACEERRRDGGRTETANPQTHTRMSKLKKYLTLPYFVAAIIGGVAALSFGIVAKILSPAANAVASVKNKVAGA
jgi:hypothetical protein